MDGLLGLHLRVVGLLFIALERLVLVVEEYMGELELYWGFSVTGRVVGHGGVASLDLGEVARVGASLGSGGDPSVCLGESKVAGHKLERREELRLTGDLSRRGDWRLDLLL